LTFLLTPYLYTFSLYENPTEGTSVHISAAKFGAAYTFCKVLSPLVFILWQRNERIAGGTGVLMDFHIVKMYKDKVSSCTQLGSRYTETCCLR
jgi:hypothetical protein